jgi:hypothetical protein
MEPQRTNALAYSEYLNGILSSAGTVTDNATTSPQGVINAGLFTENTATAYHRFNAGSQTYTSGQSYTFSVFAKSKSGNRYLIINCLSAFNGRAFFDIDNGTFTTNSGTATIEDYGNGWYRCIVTGTATATKADSIYWGLNATETDSSYTGDGTSGMYIWGAQLENSSSYPTSYIPTNGTSVTRVADASSKTGISDLIGQTEGTLFLDFVWNGLGTASVDNPMFSIGLQEYGTSNISIANYNGALYGRVTVGVNIEANIAFGAMIAGTRYKAALAYANNDVTFYVNGLSYGSDTSASIPEISSAYLQNAYPNAKSVNKVLLFPTRLDDTTLATLTSL